MSPRRPILIFAVAFMAGALAVRYFPHIYDYAWLVWLAAGLAAATLFFRPPALPAVPDNLPDDYVRHIFPAPGLIAGRGAGRFIFAIMLVMLALGMYRQHFWRHEADQALATLPGRSFFNGIVLASAPMLHHPGEEGEWRVPATLLLANGEPVAIPISLTGSSGVFFRRGDLLNARLRVREGFPRTFPGAFDFRQWLEQDGLVASLAIAKPRGRGGEAQSYQVVTMENVSLVTRIRRGVDVIRAHAIASTLEYGGQAMGPMLSAMLYGYRKDMDTTTRDTFRRVGIGHVLAISGLHVGLVVGLLWWVSGWIGGSYRARAVACLILALFYLGLTGGQVAAMRATVMAIIHLGGIAWGRKSDMLNSLGAAALLLTAANPSAPADVSFQLSFTAVFFIFIALAVSPADENALETRSKRKNASHWRKIAARLWREVSALMRINVATWFGLFPIIMVVFYQVNLVGLLINLPVIPLMSLVLAGGLALPWLGWIPGFAFILTLPGQLLLMLADIADRLPYSSFPAHAPEISWLVPFYGFFILLLLGRLFRRRRGRRLWTWGCLGAIAAVSVGLVASAASHPPPKDGRLSLLPNWNLDLLLAEDAKGNIAIIGNPSREGLREANWLHSLHRSGGVTIFLLEDKTGSVEYPALSYHNGIKQVLTLSARAGEGKLRADSRKWLPLPGMDGVEISVSRNRSGRIIWLAARVPGGSICDASILTPRQLEMRLFEGIAGTAADFFVIGMRRDAILPMPPERLGKQVRAVRRGKGRELPSGWIDRDRYGAIIVSERVVEGYDGEEWLRLTNSVEEKTGP